MLFMVFELLLIIQLQKKFKTSPCPLVGCCFTQKKQKTVPRASGNLSLKLDISN